MSGAGRFAGLTLMVAGAILREPVLPLTFPAIIYNTAYTVSGIGAPVVGMWLAFRVKSQLTVSLACCAVVFVIERILTFFVLKVKKLFCFTMFS